MKDMDHVYSLLVHVLLISFCTHSRAFNFDVDLPIAKVGDRYSQFGYSVALHEKAGKRYSLLIGAPHGESGQAGTSKAGTAYACPLSYAVKQSDSTSTREWCLKLKPDVYQQPGEPDPYETPPSRTGADVLWKNGSLLGSTVISSKGKNGDIVICAPLLMKGTNAQVDGACYILDADTLKWTRTFTGCSEATVKNFGYDKNDYSDYGSCQLGFSADIRENGGRLQLAAGVPGARNWRGGASYFGSIEVFHSFFGEEMNTLFSSSSYIGYSIALGDFGFREESGSFGQPTVVAGAPRYTQDGNTVGAVIMFKAGVNDDVLEPRSPTGWQLLGEPLIGSSFGYSLLSLKLDGDEFDDLIVGAPNFYNASLSASSRVGGAIYIYYSRGGTSQQGPFHDPIRLLGPKNSQFGASLASCGDINKDGFNDFAVGAPFAEDGGAVYIYLGADLADFSDKPSQIIYGKKVLGFPVASTFGWSLSGGVDVDQNSYPDLLVGAFGEDVAVLLRARPVLHVESEIETPQSRINTEKAGCPLKAPSCLEVTTRLRLKRALDFTAPSRFKCRLSVVTSQGASSSRAKVLPPAGEPTDVYEWDCRLPQLNRDEQTRHQIVVNANNEDWLNPLTFKFEAFIKNDRPSDQAASVDPRRDLHDINKFPIVNKLGSEHTMMVDFNRECGTDNQCRSKVEITCGSDMEQDKDGFYILKLSKQNSDVVMKFSARNYLERAYECKAYVEYDSSRMSPPNLKRLKSSAGVANPGNIREPYEVDLGNPFQAHDRSTDFELRFSMKEPITNLQPLIFRAFVNTSSDNDQSEMAECEAKVKIVTEANLQLTGTVVKPDAVYFNRRVLGESAIDKEEQIGDNVVFKYKIYNQGSWAMENISLTVDWPYQVGSRFPIGKWVLYLMEPPLVVKDPDYPEQDRQYCFVDAKIVNPIKRIQSNSIYSPRYSNSSSRYKREDPQRRLHRQTDEREEMRVMPRPVPGSKDGRTFVQIDCDLQQSAKCHRFTCKIGRIAQQESRHVLLRARLWNSTFAEDYSDVSYIDVVSRATVNAKTSRKIQESDLSDNSAKIVLKVIPDQLVFDAYTVPWWIILVAVICGVFLLFLIMIVCWWCGFFKRKTLHRDQPLYKAEFQPYRDEMD